MKIQRYPFLSFIVNDSPYLCNKNVFKYRFHIPVHLFIRDAGKITGYTMIKNTNSYNFDNLYPRVKSLIKDHTINNQTLSIDKKSFKLDYLLPFVIEKSSLHNSVIVPNQKIPIHYNNICNMDVFIPLNLEHSGMFINKPIWYRDN